MDNFFNSIAWIIISTSISVFGIFGTIFGIYRDRKSAKELRDYKYLFKVAGQHIDLEDKKDQIQDYQNQINQMQETIEKQIPKEAKRIALNGILENEIQVLSSTYNKVINLQAELEAVSPNNSENKELIKNVKKVIEPAYSQKRTDNLFSTGFFLISILSSLLSMVLPSGMYRIVLLVVLIIQLIIGFRTIVNTIRRNYTREERKMIIHKAMLLFSTSFFVVSIIIVVFIIYYFSSFKHSLYYSDEIALLIMLAIVFFVHLLFGFLYLIKESKKQMIIWLIASIASIVFFVLYIFSINPLWIILCLIAVLTEAIILISKLITNLFETLSCKKTK